VTIEDRADLDGIRRVGRVVSDTLVAIRNAVEPGVTTYELDQVGAEVISAAGARPAPALVYGFPGVNLISINDEIVHGIPGSRRIRPGDTVKVDVTVELDGYVADAAETVLVPPVSTTMASLQRCSVAAFRNGVSAAKVGRPVSAIGAAVERKVRDCGFHVIRELSGHGVGRTIHEQPTIPNYDAPFASTRLAHGMVFTIEPLISTSRTSAFTDADGWTIRTRDRSLAAHYEHTIIVWENGPEIVTAQP
jgi:methionyl aminopeptidase